MENVTWRVGVTIVLLVAVALWAPGTGQRDQARDAALAQTGRYLTAAAMQDAATVDLPWCPARGAPLPGDMPRMLDVEWLGGSPLTRQDGTPGARVARLHVWAEEDYIFYLAMPGADEQKCEWAVLDVQRRPDTRLAQAPR